MLWRSGKDTDPGPILGLDLAPRAFNVVVKGNSTAHLFRTFSFWRGASGDNGAVSLEFPILVASLEIWQVVWYPPWSGIGYILPGLGIQEISIAEFFTLVVVQLQACWKALVRALLSSRGGALGQVGQQLQFRMAIF